MRLFPFLILILISCNLEVNTSDPQASRDISTSKKRGMFITEYDFSGRKNFYYKEAWIEYSYRNKIENGDVKQVKFDHYQLVISLNTDSMPFPRVEYLISWYINEKKYGKLGTSHGNFVASLDSTEMPDRFDLEIISEKEKKPVCVFSLEHR